MKIDAVEWAMKAVELGAGRFFLQAWTVTAQKMDMILILPGWFLIMSGVPVIASGGAGRLEHFMMLLQKGMLMQHLQLLLFHYKELSIGQVKQYLDGRGVSVRL